MTISPNAMTVWRNYETDGVPASGNHNISKSDVRTWGTAVETAIDAYSSGAGSIAKSTRALLYADLAHVADVTAWVYADSTAAHNGIYVKVGGTGTGSWTRILDLPYDVIIATDAGAGTANAIVATSSLPVSESALILLNVFEANTATPVTVAFNGGSALTIKTAAGNNVAVGGLVAGMALLGKITGSTFRMVSDQSGAAIQAAAEAAQAAAEAAAAAAAASAASSDAANKVAKAGDIMTGDLSIVKSAATLNLQKVVANDANTINFAGADGYSDWLFRHVEGSDGSLPNGLAIARRDAVGAAIDRVFTLDYATGEVGLGTASQPAKALGGFKWTVAMTLASATDLNAIVEGGVYKVENPTNGPFAIGAANHAYVEVIAFSSTYVVQKWMLVLSVSTPTRPAVWVRKMVAGVWGGWAPETGIVTPSHFGATPVRSPDLATVDDTAKLQMWWNSPYSKQLDGWYRANISTVTRTLTAADNGFFLQGCGAQSGLLLDGGARFEIVGADLSNPYGLKNDQVTIRDVLFCINSTVTSALAIAFVNGDSGSSLPGLHMSNVHFIPTAAAFGPTDAMILLTNVRQRHLENVSAVGQYNAYTGAFIKDVVGDSSAPVECVHVNCRVAHFATGFLVQPSDAAPTNDDAQGYHYHSCTAIAVNRGWDISGGPEGFGEWFTLTNCHAFFREIGVYGVNAGNFRITGGYWLAHGALATCQAIAITGTVSIEPFVSITDNRISLGAATGATRIGINIPAGSPFVGFARYNHTIGATTAYSIVAGVTSVGNV